MPVAAPSEGYHKMIAYGRHKSALRWDQLTLQACAAGMWIAIYGHACIVFASNFWSEDAKNYSAAGTSKLVFGLLFSGAFMAIIYTGTELFTGNTVTMCMLLFNDGLKVWKALARVWCFSFLGNLMGCVVGAFGISFLSGDFDGGNHKSKFLFDMCTKKVGRGFLGNFVLGIACNSLVCLGTWCITVSDDGAGKILAMFYTVAVFVVGGYEHIIANFYTLTAAHMVGFGGSFFETIFKNLIPTFIGNVLAGTVFTGGLWWYALHPDLVKDLDKQLQEATPQGKTSKTLTGAFPSPRLTEPASPTEV